MLELLLALAAAPAAQDAAASVDAPASASSGPLTVSQGGMMFWSSEGQPHGQVMVIVDNAGNDPDRLLSVRTPSGSTGTIHIYPVVNGRGDRAPDGDLDIRPGRTGIVAGLADLAPDQPIPDQTTVTAVFEHAGEITVAALPVPPVAPPAPAN